jgi:hypothetical protein
MSAHSSPSLTDATVQDIQLELIRRSSFNAFNGGQVVSSLLAHRELWESVVMDRVGIMRPGHLPAHGLIKLRDLADNCWNVDTLYVLTPDVRSARELARIIEQEQDWGGMVRVHDDQEDIDDALGSGREERAIVRAWWD